MVRTAIAVVEMYGGINGVVHRDGRLCGKSSIFGSCGLLFVRCCTAVTLVRCFIEPYDDAVNAIDGAAPPDAIVMIVMMQHNVDIDMRKAGRVMFHSIHIGWTILLLWVLLLVVVGRKGEDGQRRVLDVGRSQIFLHFLPLVQFCKAFADLDPH